MSEEVRSMLSVNPLVAEFAKHAERGGMVKLSGFVGPSEPDKVRLYKCLALTDYIEIPREAVLHAAKTKDGEDGNVQVYVSKSTNVVVVNISSTATTAGEADSTTIFKGTGGGTPGTRCSTFKETIRHTSTIIDLAASLDDFFGTDKFSDTDWAQKAKHDRAYAQGQYNLLCTGHP